LMDVIIDSEFDEGVYPELVDCSVDSFESAGLLTRNDGIVIGLNDGSEFQVTVVKSK